MSEMMEQKNAEIDDDEEIATLLENNRRWVETQSRIDPLFFDRIGKPQKPKYL